MTERLITGDFMSATSIVVCKNHRNAIRYLRGAGKYPCKKMLIPFGASVPAAGLKLPMQNLSGDSIVQPSRFEFRSGRMA
jgi:hypothetical protein